MKRLLSRLLQVWLGALMFANVADTTARADVYDDVSQLIRVQSLDAALTRAESHLTDKPADPQMRFFKGMIQRSQGKLDAALDTFIKLTEDYPELPEPHNNLAALYAAKGQYPQALKALEMAIKTKPDYATAYENLADVHVRLSEQAYQEALKLEPGNAAAARKLKLSQELIKPREGSKE